ncbi:MAG: hypothetical protein KJ789_03800, partial [Alphaproteobacteria bacterium]|nr:hypothetical protein [Alphaproteobacteria bacterium]
AVHAKAPQRARVSASSGIWGASAIIVCFRSFPDGQEQLSEAVNNPTGHSDQNSADRENDKSHPRATAQVFRESHPYTVSQKRNAKANAEQPKPSKMSKNVGKAMTTAIGFIN